LKTHYYIIARCTLILQMAEAVLSHVRWALLKLLKYYAYNYYFNSTAYIFMYVFKRNLA